jgi:predicted GTPase
MEVNIQCQKMLSGIEQLEQYLRQKIVIESLDLDSNADTVRHQEFLSRLKKSLEQYTKREKNLVYIGFMGHFSAGKSSSINSLLALDSSSEEFRKEDLNPVDKLITLITHNENKDSILNTTREGIVTIRSSFINSEILKNLVIADTPGSGDPTLDRAIAQDFLPICDLIVYFLSATSPLDSADIPLLKEKSSQLEFIPIKFVVTRADEFKKTHETVFGYENFDKVRADNFLRELSQRVNYLLPGGAVLDSQSFVLVDNKTKFNIDKLKQDLVDFASISDSTSRINIHSHKVIYFQSSAEKLQDFFCDFLYTKLKSLVDVLKGAEANIVKFEDKIRIANNTLTEFWGANLHSVSKIKSSILLDEAFHALKLEESISIFEPTLIQPSLKYSVNEGFNSFFIILKNDLAGGVLRQVKPVTSAGVKAVNSLDSLKDASLAKSLELDFSRFQSDKILLNIDLNPGASLSSNSLFAIEKLDEHLIKVYEKLCKQIEDLKKALLSQKPIRDYQKLLEEANGTLDKDFDGYFDAISVYRTGVFSYGVKAAIAKLGLGQKMDELESDNLTDDAKLAIKQDAQERMFPQSFEVLNQDLNSLADLKRRAEDLQKKLKLLSAEKITDHDISLDDWKESQLKSIGGDLAGKVELDVRKFQDSINAEIHELVDKYDAKWNAEVKALQTKRSKRLFNLILSTTIIVSSVYALSIYGKKIEVPNNLFIAVSIGLVLNFASNFLVWLFARLTDKFPLRIKNTESDLLTKLRLEYNQLVDESSNNFSDMIDIDKQVILKFWQNLLIENPRKNWEHKRSGFHLKLRSCIDEYSIIYSEYLQIVEEASRKTSSYFSNSEGNLRNLNDFSSELQQKSIQPSFDLLAQTKKNLEDVIEGIQRIDFS